MSCGGCIASFSGRIDGSRESRVMSPESRVPDASSRFRGRSRYLIDVVRLLTCDSRLSTHDS
jgi:hypothetical protein